MTRLLLALTAIACASPALAQWQVQQTPLGGGWQTFQGQGPNGQSFQGTTVPLGGGWNSTTINDSSGRTTTCTTVPLGGGFTSMQCN